MASWKQFSRTDRLAVLSLAIAAILELSALTVLPMNGFDAACHSYWIDEWHKLWNAGIFYPRWLPDSFYNFGAPSFYFYPPLSYALSSLIYGVLPGAGTQTILKVLIGISLAASGFTMWLYLRSRTSNVISAVLGAMIYTFAPYRFLDYSARCALSEHVAFVFVPLAFLGADLIKKCEARVTCGLVLIGSLVFLFLTSLPASATVLLGLAVIILAQPAREWAGQAARIGVMVILAAGLTAFYWMPIIEFHSYVHLHDLWQTGIMGTGSPIVGLLRGQSISLDLYNSLCFIGASILLYYYWKRRKVSQLYNESRRDGLILGLVVLLQLPYISLPLFQYIPPFNIIQLPSRLTILLMVIVALMWTSHLDRIRSMTAIPAVITFWSIGISILIVVHLTGFHAYGPPVTIQSLMKPDAPDYATRWLDSSLVSPALENGYSIADFHNIGWLLKGETILRVQRDAYFDTVVYVSAVPSVASLHRAYWPEWKVSIDGHTVPTKPDSLGRLSFMAPAGRHIITSSLEKSTAEIAGRWISIATLCGLILSLIIMNRKRVRESTI